MNNDTMPSLLAECDVAVVANRAVDAPTAMLSPDVSTTVAYVTGASRGIGRIVATSLARDGATVVGFARPSDDLATLTTDDPLTPVLGVPLDVTDPAAVTDAFARSVESVGAPTLLITCAGSIDALGSIATVDPERWWQAMSVDMRGTMLCVRAALTTMLPAHSGRIVTMYGNLGDDGRRNLSAFASAKAGIARFTETLASELEGTGVLAVCMHPGFVRTPMTEHLASSDAGQRWLPEFGQRASDHWGDGSPAAALIRRIVAGEADALAGRLVHVDEDLGVLSARCLDQSGIRRLRIQSVE